MTGCTCPKSWWETETAAGVPVYHQEGCPVARRRNATSPPELWPITRMLDARKQIIDSNISAVVKPSGNAED